MNDFYSTSAFESDVDKLRCTIHYNSSHEVFKGHFPGNPIVPGVCTIAIVKELLQKALQQKLVLKESKGVKFLGLINPGMSPIMNLSWKKEEDQVSVTASLQKGASALFKMSGTYTVVNQNLR
jgi:3-hydroxyacyl-[acyl-carrier-protein] dehydratase